MSAIASSGARPADSPGNGPLLDVDGLRVQYGGVVAIDEMTFQIPRGSVVGLIGPNGAGKTALVDALTGYVRPARGTVSFDGRPVTGHPAHRLARHGLARTFQSVELFDDLTVSENLLVAAGHRRDGRPRHASAQPAVPRRHAPAHRPRHEPRARSLRSRPGDRLRQADRARQAGRDPRELACRCSRCAT